MSNSSKHPARDAAINALAAFGAGALVLHGSRLLFDLFGPLLPYRMQRRPSDALDSAGFVRYLSLITDAAAHRNTNVQRLKNGDEFYPAELEAIRNAKSSIDLEVYAFLKGEVADRFLEALCERARAGVDVNLVVDSIGSFSTGDGVFRGPSGRRRADGMVSPGGPEILAAPEQSDPPQDADRRWESGVRRAARALPTTGLPEANHRRRGGTRCFAWRARR